MSGMMMIYTGIGFAGLALILLIIYAIRKPRYDASKAAGAVENDDLTVLIPGQTETVRLTAAPAAVKVDPHGIDYDLEYTAEPSDENDEPETEDDVKPEDTSETGDMSAEEPAEVEDEPQPTTEEMSELPETEEEPDGEAENEGAEQPTAEETQDAAAEPEESGTEAEKPEADAEEDTVPEEEGSEEQTSQEDLADAQADGPETDEPEIELDENEFRSILDEVISAHERGQNAAELDDNLSEGAEDPKSQEGDVSE